jgi:hypothetical protein
VLCSHLFARAVRVEYAEKQLCMKKKPARVEGIIGYVPTREDIEEEVRRDDLKYWASRPEPKLMYDYRPLKLKLTNTAKYVFGRSIHFITAIPKL